MLWTEGWKWDLSFFLHSWYFHKCSVSQFSEGMFTYCLIKLSFSYFHCYYSKMLLLSVCVCVCVCVFVCVCMCITNNDLLSRFFFFHLNFFSTANLDRLAQVVSVFFSHCFSRRVWPISDLLTWHGIHFHVLCFRN